MQKMYPGIPNSPKTELVEAINATQTTITIADGTVLPDAPNICTIGAVTAGELSETIYYEIKVGNVLSGIVRGFDGTTARAWQQGTKLARTFTHYDYEAMRKRLEESASIPKQLTPGANIIETTQATPATVEFKGRSLVNIPGKDGGCESLAPFTVTGSVVVSTAQFRSGSSSLKVTAVSDAARAQKDYDYQLDSNKYYLLCGWVYIESFTGGIPSLLLRDIGTNTNRYTATADTSVLGTWQFIYAKIPKSNLLVGAGFRLSIGSSSGGQSFVAYFDEIRLYEVSDADFAAIGTTIVGGDIDRHFPYVDSVQHAQGLSLRATGKNLLKSIPDTVHANAAINGPYDMVLNATGNYQYSTFSVPATAGQTYTFSCVLIGGAFVSLRAVDTKGAVLQDFYHADTEVRTVTMPPGTAYLLIWLSSSNQGTVTYGYKNWQLELGSVATPFEPYNPQYINAPNKLPSNVDGSIADSYDSATGKVFRRWKTDDKVDGSLNLSTSSSTSDFIVARYPNTGGAVGSEVVARYDGKLFQRANGVAQITMADMSRYDSSYLYFSIARSEAGWVASINPSNNALKALMNGWKANGNNGTTYNSWASIITGTAPLTNTEAYVAANKAPGWDCYATLDYVLATPVVEDISCDLGGVALPSGSSQLELIDGMVFNEQIVPRLSGTVYEINRTIGAANNKLKYRGFRILGVYRNGKLDSRWRLYKIAATDYWANGVGAEIPLADYDPTAVYTVTYRMLDRYKYSAGVRSATLTYQSSPGAVIAKNAQNIAELQRKDGVQDFALDYIQAEGQNTRLDFDEHANKSDAHGATSTPTADKIAMYGAGGRLKAAAPVDDNDVARKVEIDDLKFSVSEGKGKIATVLTDTGLPTVATAPFQEMANKVEILDPIPGVVWKPVLNPTPEYLKNAKLLGFDIKHRNYIAVKSPSYYGGRIYISKDLKNWTEITTPLTERLRIGQNSIASSHNRTVIVADDYESGYFPNLALSTVNGGINWVTHTTVTGDGFRFNSLAYSAYHGHFYASTWNIGNGVRLFRANNDNMNWTQVSLPGTLPSSDLNDFGVYQYRDMVVFLLRYAPTESTYNYYYSLNGSSFTGKLLEIGSLGQMATGNGIFVILSMKRVAGVDRYIVHTSLDGITYTEVADIGAFNWSPKLYYLNGYFYVASSGSKLLRSLDGITWDSMDRTVIPYLPSDSTLSVVNNTLFARESTLLVAGTPNF